MKTPRSNIGTLLVVMLLTLGVAGAYAYVYHAVGVAVAQVTAARSEVAGQEYQKDQERQLTQIAAATQPARDRIHATFIDSTDEVSFIESIESLGKVSGAKVTLSGVSADTVPSGSTGNMQAHVAVEGSWTAVMRTLKLSETLPYAVSVSDVTMTTSIIAGTHAAPVWHLEFSIAATIRTP